MFNNIMIAVRPEPVCDCALDKALGLAQRFESNLHLLNIMGRDEGWGAMRFLGPSGQERERRKSLFKHYGWKLEAVDQYDVSVTSGMAYSEILRWARRWRADLIVLGPHVPPEDRRARSWGMDRPTLEQVGSRARCPVMCVPRSEPYGEQRFRVILAAVDFSRESRCAVEFAGELARRFGSTLHLLHVLEEQPSRKDSLASARERLHHEYGKMIRGVENLVPGVLGGEPADRILTQAAVSGADLIVLGHRRLQPDSGQSILGRVSRGAACPTVSVSHPLRACAAWSAVSRHAAAYG